MKHNIRVQSTCGSLNEIKMRGTTICNTKYSIGNLNDTYNFYGNFSIFMRMRIWKAGQINYQSGKLNS